MEFIRVTRENIAREHICCAISSETDCQVASKKAWLTERFDDGLVFLRADARGKCFIEYIPAEKAWAPVVAKGWMYIDCLWVAGQFKGQGYAARLLDECVRDSREKGKAGLCVISAKKKMPFLADPAFLKHAGFTVCDSVAPYYDLYCLPFDGAERETNGGSLPRFSDSARSPKVDGQGFVLYYSRQCPYTAKYVPVAERIAQEKRVAFRAIMYETAEQAQAAPAPFTAYSLFRDGEFLTNEIISEKKLEKLMDEYTDTKA